MATKNGRDDRHARYPLQVREALMLRVLKNAFVGLALLFGALWCGLDPAEAACTGTAVHGGSAHACYAIAGGNFNANGVWSATSGGGTCTCTPTTGDDVVFDGNTPTGSYSINATESLNSFDASAAGAGVTISGVSGVTVTGNYFNLSSALNWTSTSPITFTGTATITPNGHTLASATFNGAAQTFTIAGPSWITSAATTLTAGTLDFSANNPTVSVGVLSSNNSNTRTLKCGTGGWSLTGATNAVWDYSTVTGLTQDTSCQTATFTLTNTLPSGERLLTLGGQTFGAIVINAPSVATFQVGFTGAATIGTLTLNTPLTVNFAQNSTVTIANSPNWSGT